MSRFTFALVAILLAAPVGCENKSPQPPARPAAPPAATVPDASSEPRERGAVELVDAKATLDELNVANFEIQYRFTAGAPTKFYLCNIAFPGTEQWGVKPLESYEMSPQGVIRTGIEVGKQPVREFEITLSEADSPDQGYHLISNTLRGRVQTPDGDPASLPAEEQE